jgi:dimethylamine/trimethylamine dehydrogenase
MSATPVPLLTERRESSRYDVLFEPVRIGPLTTKNRFFQVPHCNGMGYRDPSAQAAMRKVKAEGGWSVVCTEQVEIHASSDIGPFIELRIWDDQDIPALARIADAIHDGGALAGIELAHNGLNAPNLYSRETPAGPGAPAGRDVQLRPGAGPRHDQGRQRRPAPLAPQRGTPVAASWL